MAKSQRVLSLESNGKMTMLKQARDLAISIGLYLRSPSRALEGDRLIPQVRCQLDIEPCKYSDGYLSDGFCWHLHRSLHIDDTKDKILASQKENKRSAAKGWQWHPFIQYTILKLCRRFEYWLACGLPRRDLHTSFDFPHSRFVCWPGEAQAGRKRQKHTI